MLIEIPGEPIGKKRPQFTTIFGRCGHCKKITILKRGNCPVCGGYLIPMPKAHKDAGEATAEGKWILMAQQQATEVLEGPVVMIAQFLMPIPKSMPKKIQNFIHAGGIVIHEKRPDNDNCLKFVKDCLNGLAWKDDSQVGVIFTAKYYAEAPRTVLVIEALRGFDFASFYNILDRLKTGLRGGGQVEV